MTIIDTNYNSKGQIYKPFWKKLITGGRAGEGLRAEWREQLKEIQSEIGFEYIRFHGLFHEDMMIYTEKESKPVYNWQYVDSLFDFLLSIGLRPFVELGFTPYDLRSEEDTCFWWKGNITPPKDIKKWNELIRCTLIHWINRYGMSEVNKWYFEVWNEPNLGGIFWTGGMEGYFELYKNTVKVIKSINEEFKVGGPSTSNFTKEGEAPWMSEFLEYCWKENLPVDFVSTHPYPNEWSVDTEGNQLTGYRDKNSTYTDLKWLRKFIDNSNYPHAEIHLTEWNSSPSPRDLIHDTQFMAPFILYNNIKSVGLTDSLGFWDFTDIFEENRLGDNLFHGGFGLISTNNLKKPSYYGYWFLGKMGDNLIEKGDNYFITKKNNKLQILMWNYCHYNQKFSKGDRSALNYKERYSIFEEKDEEKFNLCVNGIKGKYKVIEYQMNRENGSIFDAWIENGAIENPNKEELAILNSKGKPKGSIYVFESNGCFKRNVSLKSHEVILLEIQFIYE